MNKDNITGLCLMALILFALPSYAVESNTTNTNYESYYRCKTDQGYQLENGQIKAMSYMTQIGVTFQPLSETSGALAMGIKSPWSTTNLNIIQKRDSHNDLIAFTSEVAATTLRIRKEESGKLSFVIFDTEHIYAGHCDYNSAETNNKNSKP